MSLTKLDRLDMLAHLDCMLFKMESADNENEKDRMFNRWFMSSGRGLEELYGCSHKEAKSVLYEWNKKYDKDNNMTWFFLKSYMRALDPELKEIPAWLRDQFMAEFFG